MTEENWGDEPAHTSQVADITEIPEIKLFGKWSADDVQIGDISLQVGCVLCLFVNAEPELTKRVLL